VTKAAIFLQKLKTACWNLYYIFCHNPQLKNDLTITEIPALKEGLKSTGGLLLRLPFHKPLLELAVHVVEWFDSADTKLRAYAKAWSFFEDLLISDAPDALKEWRERGIKKSGFFIEVIPCTMNLYKVCLLTKCSIPTAIQYRAGRKFFFRLLTSAIYNRDFIRQKAQRL